MIEAFKGRNSLNSQLQSKLRKFTASPHRQLGRAVSIRRSQKSQDILFLRGLGDEAVHSSLDAHLFAAVLGAAGDGYNFRALIGPAVSNGPGCLQAAHLRHLQIHKDHIIGSALKDMDHFLTIAYHICLTSDRLHQRRHRPLGDWIVISKQYLHLNLQPTHPS